VPFRCNMGFCACASLRCVPACAGAGPHLLTHDLISPLALPGSLRASAMPASSCLRICRVTGRTVIAGVSLPRPDPADGSASGRDFIAAGVAARLNGTSLAMAMAECCPYRSLIGALAARVPVGCHLEGAASVFRGRATPCLLVVAPFRHAGLTPIADRLRLPFRGIRLRFLGVP